MSALKGLTFTTYTRPDAAGPEQKRRQKLVLHMLEQLEMAKASAEGRNYVVAKRKWAKNENGEKVQIEVSKRLKQWWQVQPNGTVLLTVRYGARPIEFEKGKAAIQLKSKDDLLVVLPKLISAADAGEFDSYIAAANKQRGAVGKKAA